jgi:hypothetical protein
LTWVKTILLRIVNRQGRPTIIAIFAGTYA